MRIEASGFTLFFLNSMCTCHVSPRACLPTSTRLCPGPWQLLAGLPPVVSAVVSVTALQGVLVLPGNYRTHN